MKIVNWNIEWMNRWFTGNATPEWGSRDLSADEARETAGRVARVIRALDPDLLTLQEGPSAREEMALFLDLVASDGGPQFEVLMGSDGGAQKLYALRKIGGACEGFGLATDPLSEELRDVWLADVNGDLLLESYDFTRAPLVITADPAAGQPVQIVVLHTKSKYVHRGQQLFEDPARRQEFIADAMLARRRIAAEAFRLRTYLDAVVEADNNARLIVTGDFNDGPGRDFFERSYLSHNVTDILLGSTFYPDLIFAHGFLSRVPVPALFTARFDDFVDGVNDRPLLLDHFVVSPALAPELLDGGIAHDAFDAETASMDGPRQARPSDHRPIWIQLGLPLSG
ncbi:endonuclease/exonuclease/phosphatase family protein [Puniceibacterium sp. IMCC21224]|uniref:endonuclease/exonuclease/phosphatase family protein n=1 Tax=Puniceibacterium sp. IMCC21224 TaxID=1618204 RepID=UPI00064E0158|nr:endonuclease/exonuclease/phosphatase family protein [Puniceibacterium sp. IMCC21224]KMK68425.1 endonuclease/exonuclease/phosphatase family protein [Puniceibacterium sp. IMCC21224]